MCQLQAVMVTVPFALMDFSVLREAEVVAVGTANRANARSCDQTVPRPGSAPGKARWSAENGPEARQGAFWKPSPAVVPVATGRIAIGQLAASHRDECVAN